MTPTDSLNAAQLVAIGVHVATFVWWASKMNTRQESLLAHVKTLYKKYDNLELRVRKLEIRLGGSANDGE